MLQLTENEIRSRLAFDNPWWEPGGHIETRYAELPKRAYLGQFNELISKKTANRAVILMGPRRVGKTVMVHHAIQQMLDTGTPGTAILYLSLETPVYTGMSLEQMLNLFMHMHGLQHGADIKIFFDEIQYLKNWEVHLKSLVDSYPNFTLVATGSAAAALRLKSRESGAGRFTEFMLPPLTFAEYLMFIGRESELVVPPEAAGGIKYRATNIEALNEEFVNYLNYGGYPEAVFSAIVRKDSARYIKSDIIDKVLLRDLPSLYGINDIQELNQLFNVLAFNTGNEVSLEALAKRSGVSKNTLRRYMEYLEAAFLIKRVHRLDENARHFRRATAFKVYLTNPSMRAALFGNIDDEHQAMGALTETAIFSQWIHSDFIERLHYARWKSGEVDLVAVNPGSLKVDWCIEIKWSDRAAKDPGELKGLLHFCARNEMASMPVVTTRTIASVKVTGGYPIEFWPVALMAYELGRKMVQTPYPNLMRPMWS